MRENLNNPATAEHKKKPAWIGGEMWAVGTMFATMMFATVDAGARLWDVKNVEICCKLS